MDHLINMKGKHLVVAALILAITLLSACNGVSANLGAIGNRTTTALGVTGDRTTATTLLTACHATGDPANPYEELTVNSADELNMHRGHPYDINPVPANGCPVNPALINNGKITICHATDGQNNPYDEITVSVNGLNGHDEHQGDIIPAPVEGCPVNPMLTGGDEISICHATGSRTNPYNEITVSVNGLNGHGKHEGDIIPAPAGGCPISPQYKKPNNGKP